MFPSLTSAQTQNQNFAKGKLEPNAKIFQGQNTYPMSKVNPMLSKLMHFKCITDGDLCRLCYQPPEAMAVRKRSTGDLAIFRKKKDNFNAIWMTFRKFFFKPFEKSK